MAIYKGDKEIVGLYKGPTEIIKRYKGSNLIYNVFKWLPYSYEYIYNSLVPSVINNKNVKEKARLTKISGNGVIENQLDFNGDFHTNDSSYYSVTEPDYMSMSIANNVLTCSVIRAISSGTTGNLKIGTAYAGHKYLFSTLVKSTVGNNNIRIGFSINRNGEHGDFLVNQGETKLLSGIYETITSATTQTAIIRFQGGHSAGNTFESYYYEIIDLTLMFGTGNEPTTITDNRIQALLNQGYIEYNTGIYKGTNIGEFISEPYNLFDDEFVNKGIQGDGRPFDGETNLSSKNPIEVHGGKSYTFEVDYENSNAVFTNTFSHSIKFYSGLPISSSTFISNYPFSLDKTTKGKASKNVEAPLNAKYAMIHCYYLTNPIEITGQTWCFHLTGSRTGYAPHTQPYTLPFVYQGNSALNAHDTLEITDTEYVFTKNVVVHRFTGNETIDNLSQYGTNFMGIANFTSSALVPPNDYLPMFNKRVFNKGSISDLPEGYCYTYSRNFYYNIGTNDQQANIDFITGLEMIYQLATPQVIRIPKKHLAVVDLGTLDWQTADISTNRSYCALSGAKLFNNDDIANIYCVRFISDTYARIGSNTSALETISLGTLSSKAFLYIKTSLINSSTGTTAKIQRALSGIYLFYETEDEVEDIDFEIGVEAGGTLTSNLFSWVENQQTDFTVDFVTKSVNGITIETDLTKKTIRYYGTASANATCGFISSPNDKNNLTVGHKYLLKLNKIGNSGNSKCSVVGLDSSWLDIQDNIYTGIATSQYGQVVIYSGEQVDFTIQYQIIDLTLGFGAGKEPTSIDDPRIQYIIKQGYIPTNTAGTNKSVASEVLPNIGFKMKCK